MLEGGRVTIEDAFGSDGFRVRWSVLDHMASVEVFDIIGHDQNGTVIFAAEDRETSLDSMVSDIDRAQLYLDGSIKWDGCSHLHLRETHFCGPGCYQDLVDLFHYLYIRAFELMGREPEDDWPEAEAERAKWGGGAIIEGVVAPHELARGPEAEEAG